MPDLTDAEVETFVCEWVHTARARGRVAPETLVIDRGAYTPESESFVALRTGSAALALLYALMASRRIDR